MSVKINRAIRRSSIGRYHRSCIAMLNHVPESVMSELSSRALADLLDAMWRCAQESKAFQSRDREAMSSAAGQLYEINRRKFDGLDGVLRRLLDKIDQPKT